MPERAERSERTERTERAERAERSERGERKVFVAAIICTHIDQSKYL